jgi:RNase P subunit RPR2
LKFTYKIALAVCADASIGVYIYMMKLNCELCGRLFSSKDAMKQHIRNSPAHAPFTCKDCNRSFKNEDALNQHLRDSSSHTIRFHCEDCDLSFGSEDVLNQHLRESSAHVSSFNYEDRDQSFSNEDVLYQHLGESPPAYAPSFNCEHCYLLFSSEDALNRHLRNSPAHAPSLDCKDCNRSFKNEVALNMHLRDSRAHAPSLHGQDNDPKEWSMYPSLHDEVSDLLREQDLSFDFYESDDSDCDEDYDTNIMGRFICRNALCASKGWNSKRTAITIRKYHGDQYNARVYNQSCKACGRLSTPQLDETYAERIAYRIKKWHGVQMEAPPYSGPSGAPHESDLCEGCKHGHCSNLNGDNFGRDGGLSRL